MKRIVVLFFLAVAGCSVREPTDGVHFSFPEGDSSPFSATITTQLTALLSADPIDDAKLAYRRGDTRLVATLGIGVYVPGVLIESTRQLPGPMQQLGIKYVTGTTDSLANEEHHALCEQALRYARTYNAQMLVLLTTGGKPRADSGQATRRD